MANLTGQAMVNAWQVFAGELARFLQYVVGEAGKLQGFEKQKRRRVANWHVNRKDLKMSPP
jgi:hypothetical protein